MRERMVDLVGSAEIQIPELFVSLIDTRGEAVDENLVHMTEPDETSTPLLKKKGKTLKSKTARSTKTTPTTAAVPSVEPSQGATAGSPPPAGRIDALKAAKQTLANSTRATTPELQSTIAEDIAAITNLLSPIPDGIPPRKAKERIAHTNKLCFGTESENSA